MNEFCMHEYLCRLSGIANQYGNGQEYAKKTRDIANRIESQLYRVAVMGEFKRGKSSLINALLGINILPTDILPMTAAITHVTYGEEQKIIINFKDGHQEEHSVEQLVEFATKYDEEKEKTAKTIKEIIVYYPSVLCKNHIEIFDTPGMNDSDDMTAVTLSVLGDIDAAIMVISAKSPLSITEQNLILTMIEERGIHHIVFVVTQIDMISDEEEEQDRLILAIRDRICGNLLKRAESKFSEDERLKLKARKILEHPDIFGVSSVQAMQGFVQDSQKLLKKSRFPVFKKELLTFLTAAQSEDIKLNTLDALEDIKSNINDWYKSAENDFSESRAQLLSYQKEYEKYFQSSKNSLFCLLEKMDCNLNEKGCLGGFAKQIPQIVAVAQKCFIKHLSTIRRENDTHENILEKLQQASDEAFEEINHLLLSQKEIDEEMQAVLEAFLHSRPIYSGSEKETQYPETLKSNLLGWQQRTEFPAYQWSVNPIPKADDLSNLDVMPHIKTAIHSSLKNYGGQIDDYIASWRSVLLKYNKMILEDKSVLNLLEQNIEENSLQKKLFKARYGKHLKQIEEISKQLSVQYNPDLQGI